MISLRLRFILLRLNFFPCLFSATSSPPPPVFFILSFYRIGPFFFSFGVFVLTLREFHIL